MVDFKSKLPDLKDITSIASKLYEDVKSSVGEIVQDYKQNRPSPEIDKNFIDNLDLDKVDWEDEKNVAMIEAYRDSYKAIPQDEDSED